MSLRARSSLAGVAISPYHAHRLLRSQRTLSRNDMKMCMELLTKTGYVVFMDPSPRDFPPPLPYT
jgi:hypothetical protein